MQNYQNAIIFGNAKWQKNLAGNSAQQLAKAFLKKGFRVLYLAPGNDQSHIEGSLTYASIDKKNPLSSLSTIIESFHCNKRNTIYICNLANQLALSILDFFIKNSYKIIYRHVDDFQEIESVSGYLENSAKQHCLNADLVTVSHPALVKTLPAIAKKLLVLQNAVDLENFHYRSESSKQPQDMKSGAITLGFWGSYWGNRIDWELLSSLAKRNPTWAINLIGSTTYIDTDKSAIPDNINLIEAKTPNELSIYRNYFDVCLIPYKMDQSFARHSNPIKALEYLAGYKPVVSPINRSLLHYPYTFFYESLDQFEGKVFEACACTIDRKKVDSFLEENTWTRRVEELLSALSNPK